MNATEVLSAEHRWIERALSLLEETANRIEANQPVGTTLVRRLIDFFVVFSDRHHHHAEEVHLFPALERAGISKDGGPIGVMMHEHDEGRRWLTALHANSLRPNSAEGRKIFADSVRSFSHLLRNHIAKEDRVLFQMAARAIPPNEHEALHAAFDARTDASDWTAMIEGMESEMTARSA